MSKHCLLSHETESVNINSTVRMTIEYIFNMLSATHSHGNTEALGFILGTYRLAKMNT